MAAAASTASRRRRLPPTTAALSVVVLGTALLGFLGGSARAQTRTERVAQNAVVSAARHPVWAVEIYTADRHMLDGAYLSNLRDAGVNAIVLDPPRKGCSSEALAACAEKAPRRIVYVSCDPDSLARDVVALRTLGYVA